MKINKLEIESSLFGKNVYHLNDIQLSEDFCLLEEGFTENFNPYYAQCIIESSNLQLIHLIEAAGFRFVEFRVTKSLVASDFEASSPFAFYPFVLKEITENDALSKAEKLISACILDDRFSNDPLLESVISKSRVIAYLRKSFTFPNEFLFGLFNETTNELVAIKTGEYVGSDEIIFYLSSVAEKYENDKYINILETMLIGFLISNGFQRFYSITSGYKISELNIATRDLNYKIDSTTMIFRKIYN